MADQVMKDQAMQAKGAGKTHDMKEIQSAHVMGTGALELGNIQRNIKYKKNQHQIYSVYVALRQA